MLHDRIGLGKQLLRLGVLAETSVRHGQEQVICRFEIQELIRVNFQAFLISINCDVEMSLSVGGDTTRQKGRLE